MEGVEGQTNRRTNNRINFIVIQIFTALPLPHSSSSSGGGGNSSSSIKMDIVCTF